MKVRKETHEEHVCRGSSSFTAGSLVAAVALIRAHTDKSYFLCDVLSFVLCERAGITQAISCDGDFHSYGQLTFLL